MFSDRACLKETEQRLTEQGAKGPPIALPCILRCTYGEHVQQTSRQSHTHTNKVMDEIDIFSFESKRRGAYDLPELGT